ncbi:hypothetical protein [Halopiger xanaduensis]|uniref:Uncharacterized protein n=1 Tax=Halopiger xanaduensis (strain DSM 18323 / JCM 14033 / SH-6) TaxID=797210 RepID=F8DC87_HALXS|nr:hypothetical protein [Halopiger xanaduensis]AEH37207.1 hypothetical protein Halxa_2589 [Halopiger xanaduensis SH-6]
MTDGGEPSREERRLVDPDDLLAQLFRNGRTNAVLSWLLVGVLSAVLVESLLEFDAHWLVFVAATGVVVLLPPGAARDWRVMLPWELLVVALLPILVRGLYGGEVGTFATYLAIAGVALLVTVELHMFTALRLTHWFAVALVVMTTMATAAAWTVVRWSMDARLGTAYLTTNEQLMIEWTSVTLAGFVAGVLFDSYFRRRGRRLRRSIRRMVSA